MLPKFVSIHGSSHNLDVSIFSGKEFLDSVIKIDSRASSALVPALDLLLKNHDLKLEDLDFIAVDKGPGAFTSLRVIIATVNGIAFDNKVPLIGINGLEALALQAEFAIKDFVKNKPNRVISLLNAYNNEVYFLISKLAQGCQNIEMLLDTIKKDFEGHLMLFCGQGAELYKKIIQEKLGNQAVFLQQNQSFASSKIIGEMAYQDWQDKKTIVDRIEPLYLKTQYFAIKNNKN
jgi:tRNA threonylcarbamoyladenosine biosynthesis protein TsaB